MTHLYNETSIEMHQPNNKKSIAYAPAAAGVCHKPQNMDTNRFPNNAAVFEALHYTGVKFQTLECIILMLELSR